MMYSALLHYDTVRLDTSKSKTPTKEMGFIFCYVVTGIPPDSLVLVSGNKLLHMAFLFIIYRPKEYLRAIHDLSLTI